MAVRRAGSRPDPDLQRHAEVVSLDDDDIAVAIGSLRATLAALRASTGCAPEADQPGLARDTRRLVVALAKFERIWERQHDQHLRPGESRS